MFILTGSNSNTVCKKACVTVIHVLLIINKAGYLSVFVFIPVL